LQWQVVVISGTFHKKKDALLPVDLMCGTDETYMCSITSDIRRRMKTFLYLPADCHKGRYGTTRFINIERQCPIHFPSDTVEYFLIRRSLKSGRFPR